MRRLVVGLFVCGISQSAGCSPTPIQVALTVRTDLVPFAEFVRVRTGVQGGDPVVSPVAYGDDFLEGVRVWEQELPDSGNVELFVELVDDRNEAVLSRSVVVLVTEATAITVLLTRDCAQVECDSEDATCLAGECTSERCVTGEEPECGPTECSSDEQCPSGAHPCSIPLCLSGRCLIGVDHRICEPGTLCRVDECTPPLLGSCGPGYWDVDRDGFGDPDAVSDACPHPEHVVRNADDCDDQDARINPLGLGCPIGTDLVGWFTLDDLSEGETRDSIGGYAGIVSGNVRSEPGPFGQALDFEGMGEVVNVSAAMAAWPSDAEPLGEATVEAWLRPDADYSCPDDCPNIAVHFSAGGGDGFGDAPEGHISIDYRLGDSPHAGGWINGDGRRLCELSGGFGVVRGGEWVHVAMAWSPGVCRLYVNGRLSSESEFGGPLGPWESAHIGRPGNDAGGPARRFHGAIDEVMFFRGERNESQIQHDCGACLP